MSAPEKLQTQLINFGSVREAKVSPDGNFLLSLGEDDGILAVSDASNLSQSDEYNFASLTGDRIRSFVSLPGKGVVIFCDEAHDIFRVDWRAPIDESSASKLVKPDLDPSIICVDSDGKRLAVTGSDDPQIIVWKGKKPTVIVPQMQAFAEKYLDDLPAVFYYFLDPDYWNGTTPSEQTVTQTLLNPNAPETKAKSATEIANYAVRSLYEVYQPSDEIKENYNQTILSQNDVMQLENTLLKLNNFVDKYPKALSIPSALRDSLGIRVKESVAAPFEEWVKNVKKLGLSEDLRTFLKQQGWQDENDFAKKADVMLRAVRVNRMPLPQAMAFSEMRLKYYPIDETKPLTSTQMYLKMHDAKPGDAFFIAPYADELKKSFEQGKFTRIGLPIYID